MLQCQNTSFRVGPHELLKDIDLEVRPGEILSILGQNGAGKSTLLRILSGELRPTVGSVTLDGIELSQIRAVTLAGRRAVVPQNSHLTFAFTVLEVVLLGISVPGLNRTNRRDDEHLAQTILDLVDLCHLAHRYYPSLSGGEKQRVQLARALCQLEYAVQHSKQQQYLLLDEATANLDIAHQRLVCNLLKKRVAHNLGIVIVAHDLNLAAAISDRIALMKDGRLKAVGSIDQVFNENMLTEVYGCDMTLMAQGTRHPVVLPDFET